jgi:hypothetical protein
MARRKLSEKCPQSERLRGIGFHLCRDGDAEGRLPGGCLRQEGGKTLTQPAGTSKDVYYWNLHVSPGLR